MDQAPAKEAVVDKKRKCEGADCSNDAGNLQCPTCQKLGKDAYFCGQDCFKRNWVGQSIPYLHIGHYTIRTRLHNTKTRIYRVHTSSHIRRRTVCSPTSFRQKWSLSRMQMAITTHSLPSLSQVLCDRCIHLVQNGRFPRRSNDRTMQGVGFRTASRYDKIQAFDSVEGADDNLEIRWPKQDQDTRQERARRHAQSLSLNTRSAGHCRARSETWCHHRSHRQGHSRSVYRTRCMTCHSTF